MSARADLMAEALRLPADERAELATTLLDSLEDDDDESDDGVAAAWDAEIERRAADEDDEAAWIDGDEALRQAREIVAGTR
jgi:putative addiction module component (TIGR02574 family)